MAPLLASRRINAKAVVDFPQPDSPTRPRLSRSPREKLTLFTARRVCLPTLKSTDRFFTSSNIARPPLYSIAACFTFSVLCRAVPIRLKASSSSARAMPG